MGKKPAHHEDARLVDARVPEVRAFFHGTDRQPSSPLGRQDARDLQHAVAVGVRLDHAGNLDAGTDYRLDVAVIAGNLFA